MQLTVNITQYISILLNLLSSTFAATLAFAQAMFTKDSESIFLALYCIMLPSCWLAVVTCVSILVVILTQLRTIPPGLSPHQFTMIMLTINFAAAMPPYLFLKARRSEIFYQ